MIQLKPNDGNGIRQPEPQMNNAYRDADLCSERGSFTAVPRDRAAPAVSALCESVSPVLSRVGEKWTLLLIMLLENGPRRYGELRKQSGVISKRMLTRTLRGLEDDGLVTRTVYDSALARVDYELTPLGHSLGTSMAALALWVMENLPALEAARRPKKEMSTLSNQALQFVQQSCRA